MHTKLAGQIPLQEMISRHIEAARTKLAEAEKDEKSKKEKKLIEYEKREHGGKVPSVKEEEEEHKKEASAIDPSDPEHIEKLASALDLVAEKLAGDAIFNGGEARQGGQQLPTMGVVPGKQSNKKDAARHQVPNGTGMMATKDNPGAATAVPTDDHRAPGGNGAKYPAKGVLKTAGQGVMDRIAALLDQANGEAVVISEKTAGAVDYVLDKIAAVENGGESVQGGQQLDNSAPVPSNPGRQLISSNAAPAKATKKDAKSPRKSELAQVLTEPAMTRATDSKVHENLRNADKGGVKIAAAKAYLRKIAEEGCTCDGDGSCRHCKLEKAVEAKKSQAK